jgi:hypothetical protein
MGEHPAASLAVLADDLQRRLDVLGLLRDTIEHGKRCLADPLRGLFFRDFSAEHHAGRHFTPCGLSFEPFALHKLCPEQTRKQAPLGRG